MVAVRNMGLVLLVASAFVIANDLRDWLVTGIFAPVKLSDMWISVNRGSFTRVTSDLTPWLSEILSDALSAWAAPAFAVPGLALVWLGVRR